MLYQKLSTASSACRMRISNYGTNGDLTTRWSCNNYESFALTQGFGTVQYISFLCCFRGRQALRLDIDILHYSLAVEVVVVLLVWIVNCFSVNCV